MARLFVIHSAASREKADLLGRALNEFGHFVKVSDGHFRNLSAYAREEVLKEIKNSDYVIVLITEEAKDSKWVFYEYVMAIASKEIEGKPKLIPVVVGNIEIAGLLKDYPRLEESIWDTEIVARHIDEELFHAASEDTKYKEKENIETKQQEKIQQNLAVYIEDVVGLLKDRESRYRRIAHSWYVFGCLCLLVGVAFGLWKFVNVQDANPSIQYLVYHAVVSILVLVLLLAVAKFSFTLGKSFMVESIRNFDRRHAISFGEFYLKAFSNRVEWKEAREVFQNWNIDKGSFFMEQSEKSFDPNLTQHLTKALNELISMVKK